MGIKDLLGDALYFPPEGPKARRTDPGSSHRAAASLGPVRLGKTKRIICEAIDAAEPTGLLAEEVAEKTGIRLNTCSTRMSELRKAGFVTLKSDIYGVTLERKNRSTGKMCEIYFIGPMWKLKKPDQA